jgi:hypothetical protein
MYERNMEHIDQGSKPILHYCFVMNNTVIIYEVSVFVAYVKTLVIGMIFRNIYAINFYGNIMFELCLCDLLPLSEEHN